MLLNRFHCALQTGKYLGQLLGGDEPSELFAGFGLQRIDESAVQLIVLWLLHQSQLHGRHSISYRCDGRNVRIPLHHKVPVIIQKGRRILLQTEQITALILQLSPPIKAGKEEIEQFLQRVHCFVVGHVLVAVHFLCFARQSLLYQHVEHHLIAGIGESLPIIQIHQFLQQILLRSQGDFDIELGRIAVIRVSLHRLEKLLLDIAVRGNWW